MTTKDKLIAGLAEYIDRELIAKIDDRPLRIMIATAVATIRKNPAAADMIAQDIMTVMGGGSAPVGGVNAKMFQSDHIAGLGKKEPTHVANARSRSSEASQPNGGKVIANKEGKK